LYAILYGKKREKSREINTMQKNITASFGGSNTKVGELLVNRLVPNRYIHAVGPFVFLDHLYPVEQKPAIVQAPNGEFAHPHRGIATFSYLFSGELEHFDSAGHHGIVSAGGAQWMKAGNGVIHDEHNSPALQEKGGILHAVQFWINLPAMNKAEKPEYLAVNASDIMNSFIISNSIRNQPLCCQPKNGQNMQLLFRPVRSISTGNHLQTVN
jgi:redox-sensitive bicupin YhaK (pirin superfamily)